VLTCRVPGQLRSLQVDGVDLLGQPKSAELDAIGAERVRLDEVGAGTQA
jgi:hypothetical protein